MSYVRYDYDNVIADPQPVSITVNQFSGTEGWSTVTYKDWNGDYEAHDKLGTMTTPLEHQRHINATI
jgi:hypothetical protein